MPLSAQLFLGLIGLLLYGIPLYIIYRIIKHIMVRSKNKNWEAEHDRRFDLSENSPHIKTEESDGEVYPTPTKDKSI